MIHDASTSGDRRHTRSRTRRLAGLGLAGVLLLGACGDDASSSEDERNTSTAAEAAQEAIDQGDALGDCPLGTPAELVAALPAEIEVAPGLGDDIDDGQVFRGGEVDITYCALFSPDGSASQIGELRVDVAPGSDVDTDIYLDEEFVDPGDVTYEDVDGFAGGDAQTACWGDGEQTCALLWQGADLFVSVVPLVDDGAESEVAVAAGEALVPVVVENLAAG